MPDEELKMYYYKGPVTVRGKMVEIDYYDHAIAESKWEAFDVIRNKYISRNGLNPDRKADVQMSLKCLKIRTN